MSNNLQKLAKDLRAFAKRCKDIKYTQILLFVFLLTGLLSLAAPADNVETARKDLNTSITDMKKLFKEAKQENNKLMKGSNLELIQLMEQGDQVVKTPWLSWQYGMNYFYNSWTGTYKGRGDKTPNQKYERFSSSKFAAYSGGKYGTTDLNSKVIEPISAVPVDAAVKPKDIQKEALNINLPAISAPSTPSLNISVKDPLEIKPININVETSDKNIVEPNAHPFSNFGYNWINGNTLGLLYGGRYGEPLVQNYEEITAGELWTGVSTSGIVGSTSGATGLTVKTGSTSTTVNIADTGTRRLAAMNFYRDRTTDVESKVSGVKVYVAGSTNGVLGNPHANYEGSSAIHLVGLASVENSEFNLYGKAAVANLESWRSPILKIGNNSKINVLKDENTLFNIQSGNYGAEVAGADGRTFAGAIEINGSDITVSTKDNTIFAIAGYTRGFDIKDTGKIELEGASNIVVSDLGYVSNPDNYMGTSGAPSSNESSKTHKRSNHTPSIILENVKQYGDENVTLFFNTKTGSTLNNEGKIGIYQGEIKVKSEIGTIAQTNKGNLAFRKDGSATGYNVSNVDGNVGVYAISGQRKDINPRTDLGANSFNNLDKIHNLEIGNFDIKFGKYSKDGFMFLAKNGTVMDVAKSSTVKDIGSVTTSFSDGLSGSTTTETEASTGTVIAYSEGVWDGNVHGISSSLLQGKATEINIYAPLTMVSKEGIAYFGNKKGIVNVGDNTNQVNTKAIGYGSIIGYGKDLGTVNINGTITADDSGVSTKANKYTNIGAYAKDGGKVIVEKTATINGLGAIADGPSSVVKLKATDNVINTGSNTGTTLKTAANTGLYANNQGIIHFNGGTITNKDNSSDRGLSDNDHDNVTPFYANSGQIIFGTIDGTTSSGAKTAINMYDGILITSDKSDYVSGIDNSSKYQNLGTVTVNILSNNVTIGSYDSKHFNWDSPTDASNTYSTQLGLGVFSAINKNNHIYRTILTSGKLDVSSSTVQLDSLTDEYNGIRMANEVVTIGNTTNVTGNVSSSSIKGQGLSMGSLKIATSNATTGFNNEGTINVTGGTATDGIAGMNVSFGTINNGTTTGSSASVTIDNGAGLYGTNGSKLVNNGTITVSKSGAGIAGIGTGRTKQNYGTDVKTAGTLGTTNTVEIENHGTISVAGDKAVAIYAENNTNAPKARVKVVNDKQLTVGTDGVGIAVISTGATSVNHGMPDQGGTITVTATGTGSDIITGVNGKGIYAQNSDINLIGGDYVIETPEKGIGIFASGSTNVNGTLEYKYNGSTTGTGMGIVYDSAVTNNANVKLTNATNTTGGMIGVYATATSGTFTNNGNITGSSSALEFGIVSDGVNVVNAGNITLGNATTQKKANVGIYAKANNTITNNGRVTVGDNAIGVYGYNVNNTLDIKAGDNGVAIYTQGTGTTVNLNSGSALTIGNNQAVGVYAVGSNQQINTNTGSGMTIGNNSFGIVNVGSGNTVTSNTANSVSLRRDAVYIYQNDNTGTVNSSTPLISTGDRNYGLYGNGIMNNAGVIDFSTGNGNVGMYATTGGIGTNSGTIKVGASNTAAKEFGVGMATGYYNETTDTVSNQGTVINRGTIEVSKPNTMGMYAVGAGSKAVNYGHINLSGSETVGMYIDRGAVGENWGTIQTTAGGLKSVKGVYVANGGYIKNYGTINIAASDLKSAGIWTDKAEHAEDKANGVNPVTGVNQTGTLTPAMKVATASDMKDMGGRTIKVPPRVTAPIVTDVNGSEIPIFKVDTDNAIPAPAMVTVTSPSGITSINLPTSDFMNFPSASEATSLGMYVDTSGVNYTNPIQGINNLTGLTDINLFFGTEASRYTTAKAIEVGDNILKPYNDALSGVVTAGTTLNVTSASLTWMAQPTKNAATGLLDKVYLVKVPYTMFAKKGDTQTLNFLTGLEQKYGAEGLGTKEKSVLDKISNLNGGEGHILAQAFDEMKGHQYSSIQQRTKATGDILSKEFNYLQDEWRNPSKDNNKIKVFGHGGEYNTDTAGVVDYRNNAYGVAYVHENETVKLGHKSGWYAGAVTNRFDFKDLGKSRETQTMVKAGLFKTISPSNDHNGSLTWTIAGEAFASINNMKRRYWIVDETFEAKSDYTTYGVALKNEIGKDFRTSARTSIRPYGALSMEYGRYSNIKEKGPMALELQGNDYFSVQPELGVSFNYTQPVGVKSQFTASLTAAYTNELGKVNDVRNKARLKGTTADYYELRGDKEDRKGNGKVDLNIGFDNTRFGVTFNAGYDTKGSNVRGGLGFRVIY